MHGLFHFITLALVVLLIDHTQARRHLGLKAPYHIDDSNLDNSTLSRRGDTSGVLALGKHGFIDLATSYIIDDSQSSASYANTPKSNILGGACGWAGMNRNMVHNGHSNGVVWGAAIQTKHFGKGLACGSCILVQTTGAPMPPRKNGKQFPEFIKVAVVDECPGTCKSLDLQLDAMLHMYGQPRVGQVPMNPTIVPCNFKANGIFVQVRQITNSPYDFRLGLMGNSGAIKLASVSAPVKDNFIPLVKSESNQYTLPDQSKAFGILGKTSTFDLTLISFAGEEIVIRNIKHNINTGAIGTWQNTGTNFVKS